MISIYQTKKQYLNCMVLTALEVTFTAFQAYFDNKEIER